MNELALFAGAGGGILGGKLLGWRTVCAVECDDYARRVLMARQDDGCLEPFPIWDDVRTFNGKPWAGLVDVVSGGFPCQDISSAGKGAGIDGERSGLWREMARIIREVGPRYVFVENSPMLTSRGLGRVLGDLAEMGYDARWGVLGASHAGAPHKRERIWILANSNLHEWSDVCRKQLADSQHTISSECRKILDNSLCERLEGADNDNESSEWIQSKFVQRCDKMADSTSQRQQGQGQSWFGSDPAEKREGETDWAFAERVRQIWGIESPLGRVAHGVANRVDRLRCIGNGQVPAVAKLAWETLTPPVRP